MTDLSEKRSAVEPVSALLGNNVDPVQLSGRPATTTLGAVLVFLRSMTGFLWIGALVLLWREIVPQLDFEGIDEGELLIGIVMIYTTASLVLLVLAVLIWRGSNWARILVMCGLVVSTVTSAVGHFMLGERVTLSTTLLVVAFDVLVLLALSNRDTRAWSRLSRAERSDILQRRRQARAS